MLNIARFPKPEPSLLRVSTAVHPEYSVVLATAALTRLAGCGQPRYDVAPRAPSREVTMGLVSGIVFILRALFLPRAGIAAEHLALRQQIIVRQRSSKRPRLRQRARIFWL